MTEFRVRPDKSANVDVLFDFYVVRTSASYESVHGARTDPANFVDMITDLLHLGASRGVDHAEVLAGAAMHFEAEAGLVPGDESPDTHWPTRKDDHR
jgi:hypothetical protein